MAASLLKFDRERYDVERFIIMPNHVHVLVQMRSGWELRKQCASWLRFSARTINGKLHRSGVLWQNEPFDHVIRSAEQFAYSQQYIVENPKKAGLNASDALSWVSPPT